MKKIGELFLAILLCFLFVQSSFALPSRVYLADAGGTTNGGPFAVYDYTAGSVGDFLFNTFCLEDNEFINLPGAYYATYGPAAINGGSGGPDPDPLGQEAAWIYNEYYANGLYNSGLNVDIVQEAIWWWEEEDSGAI